MAGVSPHLAIFYDPGPDDPMTILNRRFGPHFERPYRKPDTIICAIHRCRIHEKCQWRKTEEVKQDLGTMQSRPWDSSIRALAGSETK